MLLCLAFLFLYEESLCVFSVHRDSIAVVAFNYPLWLRFDLIRRRSTSIWNGRHCVSWRTAPIVPKTREYDLFRNFYHDWEFLLVVRFTTLLKHHGKLNSTGPGWYRTDYDKGVACRFNYNSGQRTADTHGRKSVPAKLISFGVASALQHSANKLCEYLTTMFYKCSNNPFRLIPSFVP